MKARLTCLLTLLLASFAYVQAADEFTKSISLDFKAVWNEEEIGAAWHRGRPRVGGLGFEVTLGGNPRLLQRSFSDVFNAHNGNREVYQIAGWMDLGLVRAQKEDIVPKLRDDRPGRLSWCRREYLAWGEDSGMTFDVSRLTPAVEFSVGKPDKFEIFAGEKVVGRKGRSEIAKTNAVPKYVAYPAKGQVVVKETSEEISLQGLDVKWMLFWYGTDSYFSRSAIPNIVWKMQPVKDFMQNGHFVGADLPVLVVFHGRLPQKMVRTDDSLRPDFRIQGTFFEPPNVDFSVLPLLGFYHPPARETEKWKEQLPADIESMCRAWAGRLRARPYSCTESYRVSEDGSQVTIRQEFSRLFIPSTSNPFDDAIAPVPPAIALAKRYGFDVKISGELERYAIATHSGPYTGIKGATKVEFTVGGLHRYINYKAADGNLESEDAKALVAELRDEVRKMIEAGPLSPAVDLSMPNANRMMFHFANPAETILALSEAYPYLDEELKPRAAQYMADCLKSIDPLSTQEVANFGAKRREYWPLMDLKEMSKYLNEDAQRLAQSRVLDETRANNVYAIWAYSNATGDWDYAKDNWDRIKHTAMDTCKAFEWANCGYFRGGGEERHYPGAIPGEDRGSVAAGNARIARWVALARIADKLHDTETSAKARYLLARTMIQRFAAGKYIQYMYDEKFQTIDTTPDWMFRLSTASGNGGGQGLLWTDHWAGAEDDVRQAIRVDEFAPVVSQMWGDHWFPIFPAFQNMTPDAGRFLNENLKEESARFVAAVEKNAPAWFITRRISNVGKEKSYDNPLNSYSVFLGHCYALGTDAEKMLKYQDIPFTKTGDLYHIRKLVANLRLFGGLKWEPVKTK